MSHIIETIRGLLMGTPLGANAVLALVWCVAIALAGYLWARAAFNREPAR
jgi:ABC-2 type transport system permease protein